MQWARWAKRREGGHAWEQAEEGEGIASGWAAHFTRPREERGGRKLRIRSLLARTKVKIH